MYLCSIFLLGCLGDFLFSFEEVFSLILSLLFLRLIAGKYKFYRAPPVLNLASYPTADSFSLLDIAKFLMRLNQGCHAPIKTKFPVFSLCS